MLSEIIGAILTIIKGPLSSSDANAALEKRAAEKGQSLNWKVSIVDLLKLLDLDSSMDARKKLAVELGYTGSDEDGSAAKNMWLHQTVMRKITERGIKI